LSLIRDRQSEHRIDAIFVDEAQFLTKEQVWQLARVADHLDVPVLAYGLRTDFRGELFEGSSALLAIADSLREVRTICECGRKATMVIRLDAEGNAATEGDQVSIGKSTYVSLCRRHWEEKMGRFPPVSDGSRQGASCAVIASASNRPDAVRDRTP
jgi:thymidine kinase